MKKTTVFLGLIIVAVVLAFVFIPKDGTNAKEKAATEQKVIHKITYESVLELRKAYAGDVKPGSFFNDQVIEFVSNKPDAKYLCISYGAHEGRNVPVLTLFDENKVELIKYGGLEMIMGCPPSCGAKEIVRK